MNLPLVVDIAIGLVFVYLILSLLASELQELLTTLLQWRAVHLKESIEGLLAGSNQTPELQKARILANRLYENPVINTLNQEAKGLLSYLTRQLLIQNIGRTVRDLFNRENVFGQEKSGPSYIGSESFATSLLETLGVRDIIQKFTVLRLEKFNLDLTAQVAEALQDAEIIGIDTTTLSVDLQTETDAQRLRNILAAQEAIGIQNASQAFPSLQQFYRFRSRLIEAVEGFKNGSFDLAATINRLEEILNQYIGSNEVQSQPFFMRLQALKENIFGKEVVGNSSDQHALSSEKILLLRSLKPGLTEAIEIVRGFWELKQYWSIYKEVRRGSMNEAIAKLRATIDNRPNLPQSVRESLKNKIDGLDEQSADYGYERIKNLISAQTQLSKSTRRNILKKVDLIISRTYSKLEEAIEMYQAELPESMIKKFLKLVREARKISLSYEYEKIRRTIEGAELPKETKRVLAIKVNEIIDITNELIQASFQEIEQVIQAEKNGSLSVKQTLLNQLDAITKSSLDAEYQALRKAIQHQPGLSASVKQSFLGEIDQVMNHALQEEYKQFETAIASLDHLPPNIQQSLLLMATAITVHKDAQLAHLVDKLLNMGSLPESVERNLLLLAQQAQVKVAGAQEELNQFRREVENWFDRSMERASGVYKRNAKLVAILVGLLIATAANADTLHIANRLSADQTLRSTVIQTAENITSSNPDLVKACLAFKNNPNKDNIDPQLAATCSAPGGPLDTLNQVTENIALPIGWGLANRVQQAQGAQRWGLFWLPRYLLGWLITGIALSMGASFWYDLLGKFINVRNTGNSPPRVKDQPNVAALQAQPTQR